MFATCRRFTWKAPTELRILRILRDLPDSSPSHPLKSLEFKGCDGDESGRYYIRRKPDRQQGKAKKPNTHT
jgi:hypothetical protein